MREILFRGKRKDNGEWVYGNLFIPDYEDKPTEILIGTNVVRISYEVIPETVGQYTELTDKNGTKIFEGDIVTDDDIDGVYLSVEFCNGRFIFDCNDGSDIYYDVIHPIFKGLSTVYIHGGVVGNIHDNPELVKESE